MSYMIFTLWNFYIEYLYIADDDTSVILLLKFRALKSDTSKFRKHETKVDSKYPNDCKSCIYHTNAFVILRMQEVY